MTERLRVSFLDNPRIAPLLDGRVQRPEVALDFTLDYPKFARLLRDNPFDVFEFSLAAYITVSRLPDFRHLGWRALPIFPLRTFFPLDLRVHAAANIRSLADLRGKRVGLPEYGISGGLWLRILLRELHDISPQEIVWTVGRPKEERQSSILGVDAAPPGVSITTASQERPNMLSEMLQRGELDAVASFPRDPYLRVAEGGSVSPLLRDQERQDVYVSFYQRTRTLPTNHVLLVQGTLLDRNPELAPLLYELFEESKRVSYGDPRLQKDASLLFPSDDPGAQREVFGADPYASGVAHNRQMVELLAQQLIEEQAIDELPSVEDLFVPSLRQT